MQPCTWICNLQHALAIQDSPPTFNTCTLKSVRRAIPILAADNTWVCTRQYCIMEIVSARCYLIVMHCRLLLKSRNIQQRLSFFVVQVFYLPILVCCILVALQNCFVNLLNTSWYLIHKNTTCNRSINYWTSITSCVLENNASWCVQKINKAVELLKCSNK